MRKHSPPWRREGTERLSGAAGERTAGQAAGFTSFQYKAAMFFSLSRPVASSAAAVEAKALSFGPAIVSRNSTLFLICLLNPVNFKGVFS